MDAEIIQRSEEWFAIRRGKVTASRIADVIATTKKGWGAARGKYMDQLIAERLTGVTQDHRVVRSMTERAEMEPEVCAAYAFYSGNEIVPVGFVQHPNIKMAGASPDGYVGKYGLIEIKCLDTANHIALLLGDEDVWRDYLPQMQFQMACSNRQWCDFASYDPKMPEDLKLWVKRVYRDAKVIAGLETATLDFLAEIDAKVERLSTLKLELPEAA